MTFPVPHSYRKMTSHLRIAGVMLAIVAVCLVIAAVVPAGAQTPAPASSPGDWTQFLRDNMQRWNPYETVLGVNNAGSLQLKWSQTKINAIYGGFIVANGVLYVAGGDDRLYAFNASTGQALWTYTAAASLGATPAVANGVIYFDSADGNVYALDASTGAKLWSYNTNNVPGSDNAAAADITVANGVVYAAMGDGMAETGTLYALDASTGKLVWSDAANLNLSTPAVSNGLVYFASSNHYGTGSVIALNARTGEVIWNYGGNNDFFGPGPQVVANGVVYFSGANTSDTGTNLYAVNASTGKTLWTFALGISTDSPPAVANGMIYIANASNLYAINAMTGKQSWSYPSGNEQFSYSAPAVANGVVYIAGVISTYPSNSGHIYGLNASTGTKLWSYPLTGFGGSPIETNGAVYLVDADSTNPGSIVNHLSAFSVGADLFLRVMPSAATVHQGDLLTYSFPVWNLGPSNADHEVLNTQVPAGTTFDYVTISGTPGLGTCTTPAYGSTGSIVCHENGSMAPNTTWTVRLTVKVTAAAGTTITENAATMADTLDPNTANNMATVSTTVQ